MFSRSEVIVACILNAASQFKLPIGTMIKIANNVRTEFFRQQQQIERAISGSSALFLYFDAGGVGSMLLSDPAPEYLVSLLNFYIGENRREASGLCLIYLNPWLQG